MRSLIGFLAVGAEAQQCPFGGIGTPPPGHPDIPTHTSPGAKAEYQKYLKTLNIQKLYDDISKVMYTSEACWPADGPQDGDTANYAGFFGRLAWHCAGTLRIVNESDSYGGCEGGGIRFWPEREWRDNGNLDQARAILAKVKDMPDYRQLSWGDLITFAGTVGIKASGGPAEKFCFGRVDVQDGSGSIELGVEGIKDCALGDKCKTHALCEESFHWPGQDKSDDARCKLEQSNGRLQASHSVGLIYVYPHGPQMEKGHAEHDASAKHQRSPRLSAEEVRDTFKNRMGWTDRETVALVGGGHTLGRAHGNCANANGAECKGKFTTTAGYEGIWTRTPSQWNYDYFAGLAEAEWQPSKSPEGNDQWEVKDKSSKHAKTFRLTADLAMVADPAYKEWAQKYHEDHKLFDADFAQAWFKLMHRSTQHPKDDDLEKDANKCTDFSFVKTRSAEL